MMKTNRSCWNSCCATSIARCVWINCVHTDTSLCCLPSSFGVVLLQACIPIKIPSKLSIKTLCRPYPTNSLHTWCLQHLQVWSSLTPDVSQHLQVWSSLTPDVYNTYRCEVASHLDVSQHLQVWSATAFTPGISLASAPDVYNIYRCEVAFTPDVYNTYRCHLVIITVTSERLKLMLLGLFLVHSNNRSCPLASNLNFHSSLEMKIKFAFKMCCHWSFLVYKYPSLHHKLV